MKTLEEMPRDATHWAVRSMTNATGMSQSSIFRIWHAFGLQPHRVDVFKLSNDPLFIEKVHRRALPQPATGETALHEAKGGRAAEAALVLCVDEKSQIQALDRTQPILPLRPGLPERRTLEVHLILDNSST